MLQLQHRLRETFPQTLFEFLGGQAQRDVMHVVQLCARASRQEALDAEAKANERASMPMQAKTISLVSASDGEIIVVRWRDVARRIGQRSRLDHFDRIFFQRRCAGSHGAICGCSVACLRHWSRHGQGKGRT